MWIQLILLKPVVMAVLPLQIPYTTYVSADSNCVYTDPTDTTITCSMAVGDTSCND